MPSGPLQKIDPRELQISLTGFLEKNTSLFCKVRRVNCNCAQKQWRLQLCSCCCLQTAGCLVRIAQDCSLHDLRV